MHFTLLLALLMTSAVLAHQTQLNPRGSACASLSTTSTTVIASKSYAPVSATGPFHLMASGAVAHEGEYAHSGAPGERGGGTQFVAFHVPPSEIKGHATSFYLNNEGHLISIYLDITNKAYQGSSIRGPSGVRLGSMTNIGQSGLPFLRCGIDSDTCALNCTLPGGMKYNCLTGGKSKGYWYIEKSKHVLGPNCVPFTPIVVAQ